MTESKLPQTPSATFKTVSSFKLPAASKEQVDIVINSDQNIIGDAVAGSGKTTTILHLAQTMAVAIPNEKILVATYNTKLKLDMRNKISRLNLSNIEAHTYHSLAVKYYDHKAYDDYKLMNVVSNLESRRLPQFTRIIIDEAQDMNELYYKFICIVIRDLVLYSGVTKDCLKFAIFGDKFQSIFAFNGADRRFIQYANVIFSPFTDRTWKFCKLSTSYRITRDMANFINEVALKTDRLNAIKDGPPVDYVICNTFGLYPAQFIHQLIAEKKYSYDEIFILAPSVKSVKSPVRKVANYLSVMKIPIFVPGSDEEPLDEDILKGKIVFSTFHQVKGLERKCVIVFGFDQSYFDFYSKNSPKDICPNTLYVAITRAMHKLYLIHHSQQDYLSFLDESKLEQFANVIVKDKIKIAKHYSINSVVSITDLTRHIAVKVLYDAMEFFTYTNVESKTAPIEIATKVDGDNLLTETVAELNGVALAAYFEYYSTGTMKILEELINNGDSNKISGLTNNGFEMSPENLLKLANTYCAYRTEYTYKLSQITNYNWLTNTHLSNAVTFMGSHLSERCVFEIPLVLSRPILNKTVKGCIDIYDKATNTLWEIKAVSMIKFEHIIQTALYGYLFNQQMQSPDTSLHYIGSVIDVTKTQYKIMNILDGKIVEIKLDDVLIQGMLEMLIYAKYFDNKTTLDDVFISKIVKIGHECVKPQGQKNRNVNSEPDKPEVIYLDEAASKALNDDLMF